MNTTDRAFAERASAGFMSTKVAVLLGLAFSGCSSSSPVATGEEGHVQLIMGTQTGGSGDELDCGPDEWEEVEADHAFVGTYVGHLELEGWRIECERACEEQSCGGCAAACAGAETPSGNSKMATLIVEAAGPVARRLLDDEFENEPDCHQMRASFDWRLDIDGTVVLSDTASVLYTAHGGGEAHSRTIQIEENDSLAIPGEEDFLDLGGTGWSGKTQVVPYAHMLFAGNEIGLDLDFFCEDCSGRVGLPLARGVLHDESQSHDAPAEEPLGDSNDAWQWPEGICADTSTGGQTSY